jgi:hypothetical protein
MSTLDDEPPPFADGEYSAIEVPDAWHVLSLVCFVAALGARFLVGLLPSMRGTGPYFRPMMTAMAVPTFAAVGLLFGLVGLRSARTRGAAKIGILLNLIVLALSGLALFAFYKILPD